MHITLLSVGDRFIESKPAAPPTDTMVKEQGFLCREPVCRGVRESGRHDGGPRGR